MRKKITNNPRLSVRKLANIVQMSRVSVHRTLLDLKLHLYHFSVTYELKLTDYTHHREFCQWFNHNGTDTLDCCFYSEEAWIHLDGFTNSQNYCLWASETIFAISSKNTTFPEKIVQHENA